MAIALTKIWCAMVIMIAAISQTNKTVYHGPKLTMMQRAAMKSDNFNVHQIKRCAWISQPNAMALRNVHGAKMNTAAMFAPLTNSNVKAASAFAKNSCKPAIK